MPTTIVHRRLAAFQAYKTLGCETKDGMFVTTFRLFTWGTVASVDRYASLDLFSGPAQLREESVLERRIEELSFWSPPGVGLKANVLFAPPHAQRQAEAVCNVAAYLGGQLDGSRSELNGAIVNAVSLTVERLPGGLDELRAELFFYPSEIHEPARVHSLEGAELDLAKRFELGHERS